MQNVNKWQYNFLLDVFGLYLGIKGRTNILQFARFGRSIEQSYRNQFSQDFDFLEFNKKLVLTDRGFKLVSRLRNDSFLRYEFTGQQKDGKERPREYAGKLYFKNLYFNHFNKIENNNLCKIYNAKVNAKALKRFVNLVIVYNKKKEKFSHQLYFSIDLNLEPNLLLEYYQTIFQKEYIYRDAKQFTGLHNFQARSKEKLYSHFNTSLTAFNLTKAHWISIPKENRKAFSMSSIKTMYYNQLLLNRFINVFCIMPNRKKNIKEIRELVKWGVIAA